MAFTRSVRNCWFFLEQILIGFVCENLAVLDLLHQFRGGAGLCHGVQQCGWQGFQNSPLAGTAACHQGRNLQKPVGTILGDANGQAPRAERIFAVLVAVLVALCDELIMRSGNGVAHMYQPAFSHLLAVAVFIFGKVQIFHGLFGQAGIVKRRALVLADKGQGLVLHGTSC